MKEHTDQHLDKLAKKAMQSSTIDTPSVDFTNLVMSRIQTATESSSIVYKPLISKKAWIAIAVGVIGVIAYMLFSNMESTLAQKFDFSILTDNKLGEMFTGNDDF